MLIGSFNLQTFHTNILELFANRTDPWVINTLARWDEYVISFYGLYYRC